MPCFPVCSAVRHRVELEKAKRDETKRVRRVVNVQRHEAKVVADKQALAALQAVNRAKRSALVEAVRRKRVLWLQALHNDSQNWIAESEVDTVCALEHLCSLVALAFFRHFPGCVLASPRCPLAVHAENHGRDVCADPPVARRKVV